MQVHANVVLVDAVRHDLTKLRGAATLAANTCGALSAGPATPAPRRPGVLMDIVAQQRKTYEALLRLDDAPFVIDPEHATPGTEVAVLWGRPGTPQREIRATVAALPFKPDHRRTDVTRL